MKDSKDTPPPPIAELWGEFKSSCKNAEFYRQLNGTLKSTMAYKIEASEAIFANLRQQLSEIAKIVPDSGGQSSIFTIDGGTLLIENTVDRLRHDNAETLSEFIAACGFWLWELQQRGKEAKGE